MTTNRIMITGDREVIQWDNEKGENGELKIEYIGNGKFEIDAEYIGLDTLYCILQHTKKVCED